MNKHPFKVGQLARSSWSYNMTFQYFWKVISVTPQTVTLQACKRKQIGGCGLMPKLVAVDEAEPSGLVAKGRWSKRTNIVYVKHQGMPYGVLYPYGGEVVSENHLD